MDEMEAESRDSNWRMGGSRDGTRARCGELIQGKAHSRDKGRREARSWCPAPVTFLGLSCGRRSARLCGVVCV